MTTTKVTKIVLVLMLVILLTAACTPAAEEGSLRGRLLSVQNSFGTSVLTLDMNYQGIQKSEARLNCDLTECANLTPQGIYDVTFTGGTWSGGWVTSITLVEQ